MISSKAFPSYAQFNEDVILFALLWDIEKGFYVDVGANYPVIDSVTKLFYEKGWNGINIEPIPALCDELREDRKRDINLPIGVGDESGEITFYENENISGHSSFSKKEAEQTDATKIKQYKVPVRRLEDVFNENKVKTIHFLKIDVEGLEESVIKGNDWEKYRPLVVCIEANHRSSAWQDILIKNNYKFFINDGLNEYYLSEESWYRTDGYADRAVRISYESMRQHHFESWSEDSIQIKKLTKLNETHFQMVQALNAENAKLRDENKLSLANKTFPERLKIALKGLSSDWFHYRSDNEK